MNPAPPIALDYQPAGSAAVLRKVAWRLIPFMVFLYVLSYLDRINVGFAALQMTGDLRFSDTIYGFGACLAMNGFGGLRGWQWLFLLEGLPSVIFGFVVLFYLSDNPTHARWLHDDERDALLRELDRSATEQVAHHTTLLAALKDARLW